MENQINEMLASQANLIDQGELEAELNLIMGINTTKAHQPKEEAINIPDAPTSEPVVQSRAAESVEEIHEDSVQLEIAS